MHARLVGFGLLSAALAATGCGGGGGGGDTTPPTLAGAPTDAGAFTGPSVLFSWTGVTATDDSGSIAGWRVQVATAPQEAAAIGTFDAAAAARTWAFAASSRPDGTAFHARVAAVDGAGNASGWSAWTDGIVLDTTPPVLAGGARDAGDWDDATVAFDWDAATDAGSGTAGYVLEIATLPSPGAVIATLSPTAIAASYDAAAHADGSVFHARVAAVDALGNQSAFSGWTDGVTLDAAAPTAPGTPAGPGAFALASPVRFQWAAAADAVSGVVDYRVRVATATDGSGLLHDGTTGGALLLDLAGTDGQTLHARVSAIDAAGFEGGSSAWSAAVVVDLLPPGAPGTPSDAGDFTRSPASFSWTAATDSASGIASYVLHVTDEGGADVFLGDVGNVTSRSVDASDGQRLFARVAAVDGAGRQGAFSSASDGIVLDTTPPVLAGGARDAGDWDDATVAFDWDAATDAGSGTAGYVLEIATLPSPGAVIATLSPTAIAASYDAAAHADGSVFHARVAAVDALGNQSAFSGWTDGVTLDAAAPTAPGTPAGPGAFALASPVRFQWAAAADAVSGVVDYRVRVATATDGSGLLHDGTTGGALLLDLAGTDGQTLHARVSAIDAAGFEGGSSAWSAAVVVDLLPPGAPGTPSDAGDFTRSPASFSWTAATDSASGIASYVLHVTDEGGADVFLGDVGNVTSRSVDASDGQRLFARVAAVDGAGRQGAFSSASDGIQVDLSGPTAPGVPGGPGPFAAGTISWSWTEATDVGSGVASYLVEVLAGDDSVVYSTDTGTLAALSWDSSGRTSGEAFRARVRAVDALGNGGPRSAASAPVVVDLTPPSVPGTPGDPGATQFERTVRFSWSASSDDHSGVASYGIEIATSPGGAAVASATAADTLHDFTWDGPLPVTLYARVRATDAVGNASGFSAGSNGIELRDDVPGIPGTPADEGDWAMGAGTDFTWTAPAVGAPVSEYVVEIGLGPGANDVVAGAVVPSSQLVYTLDLAGRPSGETYWARVAARNPAGTGGWSGVSDGITREITAPAAPGTPQDRGDLDDRLVTFTWDPSSDPESGVAAYVVTIFAGGAPVLTATIGPVPAEYTFDAAGRDGQVIQASVRARNGAGLSSAESPLSDGILVDAIPPAVSLSPAPGATGVGTNSDVVLSFSEPMDEGLVEAAFSMALGAGGSPPSHGYVFLWDASSSVLTVVPDTAAPQGETNVDLLPALATVRVLLGAGAADVAGNGLANPIDATFTTGDETPPSFLSVSVGGDPSPVPAALVQGAYTFVLAFDEDMDRARGGISLRRGEARLEARYQGTGLASAVAVGGSTVYEAVGCPDVRVGDRVTVRGASPPAFDVEGVAVTAVATVPSCTFTVANPTTDVFLGGGWVSYPAGSGARPAWTGPRTLAVTLEFPFPIPAGGELEIDAWDLADLSGNSTWARTGLQAARDPASDAVPPSLLSSVPRDLATNVPGMRPVVLRLSEPLDRSTLAGITAVAGSDAGLYRMEYSSGDMGPVLVFAPLASPPPGALVTIQVPATVRDLAGNGAAPFGVSFTAGASLDVSGPALAESSPPSGRPVGDAWAVEAGFRDSVTGRLEALDARSLGPEDVLVVDDETWRPIRGWRVEVEPGSAFVRLLPPPRGPGLWPGPADRTYTADIGLPAFLGGTGFADAHGNAATRGSVSVVISPTPNRVPVADGLRDVRIATATSPAGRALEVRLGLRDADGGLVTVSVSANGGAVPFPALEQVIDLGGGWGWYGHGGGGPPAGDDPAELGLEAFASSGWYSFEITIDDGTARTTYLRDAWLWTPAEAPVPVAVVDGGTARPVNPSRPVVVELGARPVLRWAGVDLANADFLAAYVVSYAAAASGGPGPQDVLPLPPEDVEAAVPAPLATDAYLWTIAQAKFGAGSFDPSALAWAIDFTSPLSSTMVVGPGNRALDGLTYGAARAVLEVDGSGQLSRVWDATGWYDLEAATGGEAPVFAWYNLLSNSTIPITSPPLAPELFAAGLDGSFMLTDTPPGAPLPEAAHGLLGGGGTFFAVANASASLPSITAGALRYAIGGFPAQLPGPMVYVQIEAGSAVPGVLDHVSGTVGTAVHAGPGQLDVVGTSNDGSPFATAAPYTIFQDGVVEIDIGGSSPGTEYATGYLGGAPGAELAAVASDSTPDRIFWLLMAREAAWAGTETTADFAGAWRFADLAMGRDPATGALVRADGASGSAHLDGAGGFTYSVRTAGGTMTGAGTYTVDPAGRRVRLEIAVPGGTTTIEMVAGPDLGTLLGLSTQDPDHAEVLVLSRAP